MGKYSNSYIIILVYGGLNPWHNGAENGRTLLSQSLEHAPVHKV